MANKKKKILEEALKMHEAAGGTYSSPEAAAKQQYANTRHETAKNAYNQMFMEKAAERKRKKERERTELGNVQTMRTSGAERVSLAEARAAEAKKAFEDYMGSDERKQRTAEQQKKQEQNRFILHLLTGTSDIMQPEIIQDDKETQLRKASEDAKQEAAQAKRLAPMADYLARFPVDPEERSQEERTTVEALREFDQMPYADRAALESYAVNGYRDQNLPIELAGIIPTAQQEAAGLIARYGKGKVNRMAAAYMRWQNAQLNEQVAQKSREAVDSGAGGSIGHNIASVAANVGGGIVGTLGQLQNRAMEAGIYGTVDPNAVGSAVNTYVDSVRDETFQNITGDQYNENGEKVEDGGAMRQGAGYLYQAAMSAADSVARMWAAGAFGGGTGLASGLAATQAFSRSMAAASANGATPAQAALSAAADATWEYLSEKLPLDKLIDMAPQKNFRAILGNALKQAGIEIVGEEANLVASLFSQAFILKEKSDFNLEKQRYMAQGMSEEEATKAATANLWEEAKQTAIVAGMSGGFQGATQTLTGAFGQPDEIQNVQQEEYPTAESPVMEPQEESPLSVQQDPVGQDTESAPVMPEEAAGAPETRELDVVTQAVQQAQQNRETVQNAQQEPTLAQQLTPEQRVQEAVKGVRKKEEDGVKINTPETGGVWNKLRSYTQSEKENWKYSKRIVLCDGIENFRQFVSNALTSKEQTHKKMYFGAITQNLATEIKNATGVNVEGYNLSLGEDEIRKIKKSHGNEKTETSRGQRPVTEADYLAIPDIVQNADSIKRSDSDYEGKPALEFRKRNGNELTTVVAVVSDKRLDVFVQTAYINKKGGSIATPESVQADSFTPVATGGTAPVSEDPQGQKNVHPGATPKAESAGSSKEATQSTNMNSSMNIPAGSSVATIPQLPQEVNGNPAQESNYYDEFEDWGADPNREGVGNPLADRNYSEVGKRSIKAYMYENPAVKPFYQEQAAWLLSELADTTRGERTYNDQVYYESGGEKGWYGTKRHTSESIAELLDQDGMTYEQIERGLNAIIRDNGEENNAASKRIEFVINDRLMNGYTDFYSGERVPGNAEYLNLLRSQQQAEDNGQPAPEGMKGTGAAEQNFTGKAAYADLLQKGNVQRDRPGDVRPVEVPKTDGAGRRVTEFAGNAYGAKATPDYMANEIESLIQDGKLGFDTRSNQESLRRAADALEGNTEGVKAQITENLANDKVQDGDIEKAMLLYVKNANSKDKADQEAAAQTLVQLGKMANITGRNLQLFSMLRRMTPEGQLLYAEKSARSMVEGLNKNRSVNKKIVSRRKEQAESAVKAVEQAKKQAGSAVARNSEKVREALTKYAKGESSDKKPVQAAIRAALKDIGETLDKLARSGEKTKAATGTEIVELLTKKYGFDQADASHVADVVKAEYQRMVREKSQKILAQSFKERKPREQKTSDQIFDELANLGAFDADSEFNQAAAEKWLKTKDTYIEPELAKAYLDAKTDDEKEAALDNIYKDVASRIPATLGEKWDAWRNVAMLLNPKTHIRNMGATGSFLPFVEVKRVIGAGLEKALLDEEQRTKAVLGSDKRSKALLKWAKEDAKKPKVIERLGQSGTTGDNARSKIQEHRQILPGILDKVRKGNMAVMEAEDRFFKRITYARSLASFLKARGYSETDIQGGLVPAGVLEEGRTLAIQEAQKATFNDRNAFSDTIAKLGRGADKIPVIGKVISKGALPFLRTPANVVARAWDYSPMKLAETFYQVRKGDIDAATVIDQVSSSLTGTAAMALGAALAAGIAPDVELVGRIEDEDEKESGATEYSLRVGDKYYSVSWLSPTMIPLFIGANLYDKFQALGEENGMDGWGVAQAFMEVGAGVVGPMLELSMLSSLNDAIAAFAEEDDPGMGLLAALLNSATSYFTQGLPTIFGQAEQATETEKSSTYVNTDNKVEKVIKKALGNASRRIPGIDLFQTPRLDEFGQVVKNEGDGLERAFNAFLNPFNVSQKKTDPISQELSRLRKAGAENASIPLPQRTISYTDTDGEKHTDVRLSQEQFQKLAEKQGQTEQAVLSALLESDDFRAMSDEVKDDVLAIVHSYAKETGELAAVENHLGYSATWMEELAEADDPAKYIVQRVAGTNLNRAMTDLDTAWDHSWNTTAKERALDEAYAEYKSMSKEAQKEIETFATGTAKKYLEARGNGISHKDFLAAAKNVETVKGTGKYNSETKKNTVKDIDKREAIAKTTGLTERQVDIIMKAYMPDYDPDAEKKEKTELKYDYIRQELGMTPVEYADTYRAYLENAKKHEKIAAIQDLGYDYTTASKLYRLYNGKIDVVAWAGK